jgi:hypothetical protein
MNMKIISKTLAVSLALIIFLITTIVPASAANNLEEIDEWVCDFANGDDYPNMTRFMAQNIDEQGPELIAVEIIKNPSFSFWKKNEVIRTYYIEQDRNGVKISSPDSVISSNCDDIDPWTGNDPDWTFRPTISESEKGIGIIIFCENCMQHRRSQLVHNVWKMLRLWMTVENDGVPTVTQLIINSSWLNRFLPNWW